VAAAVIVEHAEVGIKIADGELALKVAEESLSLRLKQLALEKQALDAAKKLFDLAADAAEKNDLLILQSKLQAKASREAINAAEKAATEATNALTNLENAVDEAHSQGCDHAQHDYRPRMRQRHREDLQMGRSPQQDLRFRDQMGLQERIEDK
jgi:hypothetical protein